MSARRLFTIAVLCGALSVSALAAAQELSAKQQELWSMEEAYWSALAARDVDQYMGFFDPGCAAWPANSRAPVTAVELRQLMEGLIAATDEGYLTYELRAEAIEIDGKTGLVMYTASGSVLTRDGNTRKFDDRFMHVWKRSGGSWLLAWAMGATLPREMSVDPQEALREARDLVQEGRYEDALQKYVWFHHNALAIRPELAGFRLSYALNDWAKLGDVYPRALDVMASIRDQGVQQIVDGQGSFELFNDVAAINGALGVDDETYELFLIVHDSHPTLAPRCFYIVRELLVEHRQYELCDQYIEDYAHEVEQLRKRREMTLQSARRDPEHEKILLVVLANLRFSKGVAALVEVLIGVGRHEDAEAVRAQALEVLDDDEIRRALKAAAAHASEPAEDR